MSCRKRVGGEPTTHRAKERIAGLEDREDHRTPCASAAIIRVRSSAINFCGRGEGHGLNLLENARVGTHFVVSALSLGSNSAIGEQLPNITAPQKSRLDGAADGRLAEKARGEFPAPGHLPLHLNRYQPDRLGQF